MQLMDQALQTLLAQKRISMEEAHRYAVNKAQFPLPAGKGGAHG